MELIERLPRIGNIASTCKIRQVRVLFVGNCASYNEITEGKSYLHF